MLARLVVLTAMLVSAGGDGQPLLWLHCGQWLQLPGRDGLGIKAPKLQPGMDPACRSLFLGRVTSGRENIGLY